MLDRKFSNNVLLMRGAFYALRWLFAISQVRRDATITIAPPSVVPALPRRTRHKPVRNF